MRHFESISTLITVQPNGVIVYRVKPDWKEPDTAEVALDAANTLKKAVDGNICGILTYAPSLYIKKEVLEAFSTVDIGHIADAIVVKSVGSKIFANFVLKFVKTPTIKKVFTNPEKAEKWLLEQVALAKQNAQSTLTQ